jgi:peptide deformylase
LYVDRLSVKEQKQARKAIKANGWGEPGNSWSPGKDFLEP